MHRSKKKRNIIIFSLVGVLLCMAIGYAAFQTQLKVTGTTKVTSNWDIEITNVTSGTPTGSAENAVAPSFEKLWASMEANLYDKGDAMEYDVTIENKGTLDAKLNDIITNLDNSNNDAVIISFSGYTKGEVLKAKNTKVVHVKIEYNPKYEGGETSSEVEINFDYGQESSDPEAPKTYLITYDCVTNGGNDCSNNNEYLISGSPVDLTKTGTKENNDFIGWNTDKDAEIGLTEITVENSNIILYAIYKPKDETPPIIDSISTSSTSNSITVIVSAHDDESKIVKYEYSNDDGKTWISNGGNNSYTFTSLTPNTTYNIKVKVTNENDLSAEADAVTSIDITDNVTDNGDGLYEDEYEDGRYVYKGTDPNNYIEFNDELWRIVAKEADGTYKIVRNDVLSAQAWSTGNNTWANASLKTYLNGDYYDSLTTEDKGYIQTSNWPVGAVTMNNDDMASQIVSERGTTWTGNVGLLTHSDYLRANTNKAQCGTDKVNFSNYRTCKDTDWLYTSSSAWWTISPSSSNTTASWQVTTSGDINVYTVSSNRGVRPSVYLKSSITLNGQGTKSNPYKISNGVTTDALDKPTFTEEETDSGKDVTIHYPNGCGSTLTCTYQKDDGEEVEVNQKEVVVSFDKSGSLTATVSDGKNKVNNSYTVTVISGVNIGGIEVPSKSENGGIYTDDHDNLRYYGSDPDNYVSFNNELWRIIGVVDGKIKIIRNESIGAMQWNSTRSNNWDNSSLKTYLNGTYYNSINSTYRNMISSETFYLGGPTASNYTTLTASGYYNAERDSSQVYSGNPASTTQNIGLMYPSDYGYAAGSSCLSTELYSYGVNCKNSDYLFSGVYEWLQAPYASNSNVASQILPHGAIAAFDIVVSDGSIRPVTYLKTTVQITGGDGTKTKPFTIANSEAEENISLSISTTSTTNSITVVANAKADSGIAKYEYSKDGGKTWKESTNNTYTFTGLTPGTAYNIKVRVTSNLGKILEKGTNVISLEDLVSTNPDELYTDENGDIRYYGATPNNYVSFNNELWRIIGVIDGKIKIIKDNSLTPITTDNGLTIGTSNGFYWNSVQQPGKNYNNWEGSTLQTYLNGTYYNSINSTYKNMISSETFYLGGATSSNYQTLTASGYYNAERDSSQVYSGNPASTTQHIGLMYTSDYGYAAGESYLSTALYAYACQNSNYLYSGVTEWLQSPFASGNEAAAILGSGSAVNGLGGFVHRTGLAVRPVTYLKTTVQITGGDGSQNNPFKLGNGTSTTTLEKPTFNESETSSGKNVTINYPAGCGSTLTCTYQKDDGTVQYVYSTTANVSFTASGSVVAKVSDGTNTVSSSYTVIVGPSTNIGKQPVEVVESGDGLYEDTYESGRYVYRGQEPDNYIMFNDELWRIIAKEADGTYKIIRNDVLANRAFDEANHRTTEKNSYCTNPQYGCGVYAAVEGTFSSPSGSQSGTVTEDSSIKLYLNDDYYVNDINATAKEQMISHSFNIGAVENLNQSGSQADSIEKNIAGEKMYQWTGNVGLANVSDILRASTNPLCTSATTSSRDNYACNSNYLLESASSLNYWTINAFSRESGGSSFNAWQVFVYRSNAYVNGNGAFNSINPPRPVVFLKSDTTLSGSGTLEDPFTII